MTKQIHTTNTNTSFIGLRSYTEEQAGIFFGRDAEIEQLTSLVEANILTIVFGKSGTGKTSLLNAGVFPRLRKNYCLPFRIRLEFQQSSPDLVTQVKKVLKKEIDKYGFKVESYPSTETFWEYFHKEPLWKSVTPILIFDQFEELFTLGQKNTQFGPNEIALFWEELSDVIENSIPEKLRSKFLDNKEKVEYDYKRQKLKVLFSFREEFLPEFETLAAKIPSIKLSRFRLMPMNGKQAYEVITKTWGNNINPAQADRIVSYFSNEQGKDKNDMTDIEPSLLSQVCSYIEKERVMEGGRNVSEELLNKYPKETILRSIYNEAMNESNAAIPVDPNLPRNALPINYMNKFVEEKLITDEGYRIKYNLTQKDSRLLPGLEVLDRKYFVRRDDKSVELTHDVLAPLIKSDREKERKMIAAVAANKKARKKAMLLLLITLLAAIATYVIVTWSANEKRKDIEGRIEELKKDSTNLKLSINASNDSLQKVIATINRHHDVDSVGYKTALADAIKVVKDSIRHEDSVRNPVTSKNKPGVMVDNPNNNEAQVRGLKDLLDRSEAAKKELDATKKSLEENVSYLQAQQALDKTQLARWRENFNRLQKDFDEYRLKYPIEFPPTAVKPILPDEKSLYVKIGFPSPKLSTGAIPFDLTIYLIPVAGNKKLINDISVYEIYCNYDKIRKAIGVKTALYHDGKYFFPDVAPNKDYFIKVCSYYGGYKFISKKNWKKEITMQISPPVQ